MLPRSVVSVFLGQPEVDQEELVTVPPYTHQEVVGFYVAVDEVFIMHIPGDISYVKFYQAFSLNLSYGGGFIMIILNTICEQVVEMQI